MALYYDGMIFEKDDEFNRITLLNMMHMWIMRYGKWSLNRK